MLIRLQSQLSILTQSKTWQENEELIQDKGHHSQRNFPYHPQTKTSNLPERQLLDVLILEGKRPFHFLISEQVQIVQEQYNQALQNLSISLQKLNLCS